MEDDGKIILSNNKSAVSIKLTPEINIEAELISINSTITQL